MKMADCRLIADCRLLIVLATAILAACSTPTPTTPAAPANQRVSSTEASHCAPKRIDTTGWARKTKAMLKVQLNTVR